MKCGHLKAFKTNVSFPPRLTKVMYRMCIFTQLVFFRELFSIANGSPREKAVPRGKLFYFRSVLFRLTCSFVGFQTLLLLLFSNTLLGIINLFHYTLVRTFETRIYKDVLTEVCDL